MTERLHDKNSPCKRVIVVGILTLLLITGIAVAVSPHAALAYQADPSRLPISFPAQSAEVAAYFNQIARPDDIITFPFQFAHLLPLATAGQKLVGFASWKEAERELPNLIGQVDLVMYNPEHWENTPADEQMDMEATIRRAADLAHAHGLKFVFAPDRQFAEKYLGSTAAQVDIVLLQGQRIQAEPSTFAAWISEMARVARAANPEVKVFVQVGATRGSAQQMYEAIETVAGEIDGIAVWSMPRTLDILQEFVAIVRGPASSAITPLVTDRPSAVSPAIPNTPQQAVADTATPTARVSSTSAEPAHTAVETWVGASICTPLSPPQASTSALNDGAQTEDTAPDLFLAGGSLVAGIVLGIFLGVWLTRRSIGHAR